MKLIVLVDNNTYIDHYYFGEPGASYYIEDGDIRLLFDVGYSDICFRNAQKMGINLQGVSTIALSHGHDDHTRGLDFLRHNIALSGIQVVAHPNALLPKYDNEGNFVGSPLSAEDLAPLCTLNLTKKPLKLSEKITFLGEIPSIHPFEKRKRLGTYQHEGKHVEDTMLDDTALVYEGKEGLFIITGCSHSGICNIVEYATRVCDDERVTGVIGGFHLFELSEQVERTIDYFKEKQMHQLYPCHCVSLAVKIVMDRVLPIQEVGVGLTLEVV